MWHPLQKFSCLEGTNQPKGGWCVSHFVFSWLRMPCYKHFKENEKWAIN